MQLPLGCALMLLLTVASASTAAWRSERCQRKINACSAGLASAAVEAVQNRGGASLQAALLLTQKLTLFSAVLLRSIEAQVSGLTTAIALG